MSLAEENVLVSHTSGFGFIELLIQWPLSVSGGIGAGGGGEGGGGQWGHLPPQNSRHMGIAPTIVHSYGSGMVIYLLDTTHTN